MSYRGAAGRAKSRSPVGIENRGRGTKLSVNTDLNLNCRLNGEASSFKPATSAAQYLFRGSVPDETPVIVSSDKYASKQMDGNSKTIPTPIGPNGISPTRASIAFTTDIVPGQFVGSHYVKLVVKNDNYVFLLDEMNRAYGWQKLVRSFFVMPESDGKRMTAYAVFDDVRRAAAARDSVNLVDSTADVNYVTQQEFAAAQMEMHAKQPNAAGAPSLFYDGQVMLYGKYDGHISACKPDGLFDAVRNMVQQNGEVLAFGELDAKNGMARFRVELYSIKAAKEVVKKLTAATPADVGGWLFSAQELPNITSATSSDKGTGVAGRDTPFGSGDGDSSPTFVSPTGRTAWQLDPRTGEVMSAGNNGSDRTSPPINGGAITMHPVRHFTPPAQLTYGNPHHGASRHGPMAMQQNHAAPHPYNMQNQQYAGAVRHPPGRPRNDFADNSQAVSIEIIRQGLDVRTTLMLRNLPNQMTCHKLKSLLDLSNFGDYDFSYVRIDYEKGASVGYGFVNFINAMAIVVFLEYWQGRPWMPELDNRRGAGRLAEVSYATIQGTDCCIEKFRNSSVMTEMPDYRPKLFLTKETAPTKETIGQEIDFPEVNNMTKHQRSLANATQIGLFPPQSRRGPGGQHRPIRSQYDRGTTAQQQEDMVYQLQQQVQQMHMSQHFYPNGAHFAAPGQYAMPPMSMPMQQAPFNGVVGYDSYGNPIFAHPGAMMAPNGYHGQMQPNMGHVAPGYANGTGYVSNRDVGPRNHTRGHRGGQHAAAVPRVIHRRYDADDDPNAYDGDVDVAQMTGYFNPFERELREERK